MKNRGYFSKYIQYCKIHKKTHNIEWSLSEIYFNPISIMLNIEDKNKIISRLTEKTGEKFLKYVLNYHKEIKKSVDYSDFKFNQNQESVITQINELINVYENIQWNNETLSLKKLLFEKGNTFNDMRKSCGGEVSSFTYDDKLIEYIINKAIQYYPCLLLKNISFKDRFYKDYNFDSYFNLTITEGETIKNLLLDNEDLNKLLFNQEGLNTPFYHFNYKLSNNSCIHLDTRELVGNIITRSFINCCYRIKYNLESVLEEVRNQYVLLKEIANEKEIEFSFFCGIAGLKLDGLEMFNLDKNTIIRNINERNNPAIKYTTNSCSDTIFGCTLEFKYKLKSLGKLEGEYELESSNSCIDDVFTKLIISHIIELDTTSPWINITFIDYGYPAAKQFSQPQLNSFRHDISSLNITQLTNIKNSYEKLSSINLDKIRITLFRLKTAVYNREDPLDSMLDGFITWESMFNSDINTTKSVTKSIYNILENQKYTISEMRLKKLYDLRSAIVHGNSKEHILIKGDVDKNSLHKTEEVKNEVIKIAIIILKYLLDQPDLINKTPKERVEMLLKPKIIKCDKCDMKKYEF